jgi:hypothetical protein
LAHPKARLADRFYYRIQPRPLCVRVSTYEVRQTDAVLCTVLRKRFLTSETQRARGKKGRKTIFTFPEFFSVSLWVDLQFLLCANWSRKAHCEVNASAELPDMDELDVFIEALQRGSLAQCYLKQPSCVPRGVFRKLFRISVFHPEHSTYLEDVQMKDLNHHWSVDSGN